MPTPTGALPFDFDADTFNSVLAANVTGPMMVTRCALPLLRRGHDLMIVNVSSQLGLDARRCHQRRRHLVLIP